jgi:hypothetical protein
MLSGWRPPAVGASNAGKVFVGIDEGRLEHQRVNVPSFGLGTLALRFIATNEDVGRAGLTRLQSDGLSRLFECRRRIAKRHEGGGPVASRGAV